MTQAYASRSRVDPRLGPRPAGLRATLVDGAPVRCSTVEARPARHTMFESHRRAVNALAGVVAIIAAMSLFGACGSGQTADSPASSNAASLGASAIGDYAIAGVHQGGVL